MWTWRVWAERKNEIEMNTERKQAGKQRERWQKQPYWQASSKNETNRPHSQHRQLIRSLSLYLSFPGHRFSFALFLSLAHHVLSSINIQAKCSHSLLYFSFYHITYVFLLFFSFLFGLSVYEVCSIHSEWHPTLSMSYIAFYSMAAVQVFWLLYVIWLWVILLLLLLFRQVLH